MAKVHHLILTPTRELAQQIFLLTEKILLSFNNIAKPVLVIGGVNPTQTEFIENNKGEKIILISTVGRLNEILQENSYVQSHFS